MFSEVINKRKNYYKFHLASKLNNPKTSAKTFYRRKKIPLISPLLHNNTPIIDFKQTADLFNNSFAWQCSRMVNSSSFISDTESYKSSSKLPSLSPENDDILKLIRPLNIQKAHGPNDISIHMIKVCDS